MRTLYFVVAGLLLMGGFLLVGKQFASQYPQATRVATFAFVAAWLVVAGANMWLGVSKAGYSVAEEFPIFLLIFAVPVVIGVLLEWRVL
jgi:hypothetical protein